MKSLFTALLILFCFSAYAQNSFNIKGVVEDTLGNSLIASTVLLLEKKDSTMVKFTRTELDGSFMFRKVEPGNYLVKTTYIGYIPLTIPVSSTGENVNLEVLKMKEIAEELMQVVIKAAKAPIKMRGDTIEYDASTFQVPEGSSVEELLRQLPGIEVEQDGSVTADGKNVDQVTVDGKKFFGNDPKAATKNLPAEGISKVQVFDSKTESEEITGSTEESESKTMNLELKDEFKKGGFGKITGGIGTESRAELKGNYNKFNEKIQFSIVGVGNNTGRNGLGWNDYQDFMGSQSFNFSDDGDFGFGGGGGFRYFTFGGGGSSLESSIQSLFFNSGGAGFPENYNAGANLNYTTDETEISSVYYYNRAGLDKTTVTDRTNFLLGSSFQNISERVSDELSEGHRAEFSIDQEIDSLSSFKIEINGAYINEYNQFDTDLSLRNNSDLVSETTFDNEVNTNGYLVNAVGYYRKKFKKKGRRFGASTTYLNTSLTDIGNQLSSSNFYSGEMIDSVSIINQNTDNLQNKVQYKANAVFVEPLGKKFFSQTFYNYSNRLETGDRTVEDINGDVKSLNAQLSRTYENTISYHRAGSAIRYFNDGLNVSIGAGAQVFNLFGNFESKVDPSISGIVDKQFIVWIPHFSLSKSFGRNARTSLSYNLGAVEPEIAQLQPIVDNTNPLYIVEGNPELTPETSHNISARVNRFWPMAQVRLYGNIRYSIYTNDIINSETVDENLVTQVKPVNYEGGDNTSIYAGGSFPIYKRKLKGNANLGVTIGNNFAFVNSFLNRTNSVRYSPGLSVTWTPTKEISLRAGGDFSIVDTKYDINVSQNQRNINNTLNASLQAPLFLKVYLNSSLDYTQVINERFNVNETIPILNASIYRHFLPGNKLEVRLSIYDAFNRNIQINQTAFGNSVSNSSTGTLARYMMVSMTYNIKGLKNDANKGGFWH
jgi:hypothetical protein